MSKQSPSLFKKIHNTKAIQAGTVEFDGEQYEVIGNATLPVFKVSEETPVVVKFIGPMTTRPKMAKDGQQAVDEKGKPQTITLVPVADARTGEMGQMVVGVVVANALLDYKDGYEGKTFRLVKHAERDGVRTKPWTVQEVAKKV